MLNVSMGVMNAVSHGVVFGDASVVWEPHEIREWLRRAAVLELGDTFYDDGKDGPGND